MRTKPAQLMPDHVAKAPPKPTAPSRPAEPLKWYRVTGGPSSSRNPGEIGPFRRDQGDYFLKQGNEINSAQYDIRALTNQGVKLDPIDPPGWWVQAQQDGFDRAAELRADGADLGPGVPVEDLVPAPIAPTA